MIRRIYIILLLLPLASATADGPIGYSYGDPTADEQYGLELINRARMDPEAERIRLGVSTADWPAYPARPPFVMNADLLAAARSHAKDLHDQEHWSPDPHVIPGELNANGRVRAAGYALAASYPGDDKNSVENLAAGSPDIGRAHDNLMVDEGFDPPDHRRIVLSDSDFGLWEPNDEAGVGIFVGTKGYKRYYAMEFAHDDDTTPFLTGVCYEDLDGNGFYDPGEGIGGVTIETLTGGYSTVTASEGGYAIPIGSDGTYTVRASGGGLAAPIEKDFTIDNDNVKVDFVVSVPQTFANTKSTFKVNFKKRLKAGSDVDSLVVKVALDPTRLPVLMDGTDATIEFGTLTFGPWTLTEKGSSARYKSAKGVFPKESLSISEKTGKLTLKVKKADLMSALGVVNETIEDEREFDVRIVVGTTLDATATIRFALKSTLDKTAKGTAKD